ncbi:unnamed protein product [Phytophthora fragariaefolia]|uniref:Unnamed protein product n=1 Tax=Phytophthora fragariaefolia TaxID=1490495 RepID=A0A9W6TSZ4_9STRA|nr:unnamed protein product [Phytophthora fragariaefolia]
MCAGQVDATLEEVASILRSNSEAEHNAAMVGLYNKGFIFGSFEREVPCSEKQNQEDDGDDDDDVDCSEQLAVKTKSFARTAILGHNEQWCYFDYFQRKKDRNGFMITKRALPPMETTPGRIVDTNTKVDQLHGLNASYLVDEYPDRKGLRIVFHAWFDLKDVAQIETRKLSRRSSDESTSSSSSTNSDSSIRSNAFDYSDAVNHKAQMRRLLVLAHGVTKLPDLVLHRRFGVQTPVDLGDVHVQNTRCPCCTHSLTSVKLTLSLAASAIANRRLNPLSMDTRRCFLCGYLVCVECWSAEKMESTVGRVAAIVVCTRCHANVNACEYSEVFAGTAEQRAKRRGPPRVVEDSSNKPTVSLLVDFLSTSLLNAAAGSPEYAAAMAVIRTLLRQNQETYESSDSEDEDADASDDQY